MSYVDGFLLVVPKKNLKAYVQMAAKAGEVWREHGALDYKECVGEDLKLKPGCGLSFPKLLKLKASETAVFSYILYKSRAHRDSVNKKVMSDKRMNSLVDPKAMPFEINRMSMGGFEVKVDA